MAAAAVSGEAALILHTENSEGQGTAAIRLTVSIPEAARALSIAPRTVRAWIKAEKLHAIRIGRRVVIRVSELERFLSAAERAERR